MNMVKKIIRCLGIVLAFMGIIVLVCMLYINIKYEHIDKEIRLIGVVADLFVSFEDEKALKQLSENTPTMPVNLSDEVILEEIYITFDNKEIRTLVMKPTQTIEDVNAVVWLHGGGYALKSPEDELILMEKFVLHNGAVVIAPDYTLSVEEPYPAAIEECYQTLLWVKNNATSLKINENQIFVGGGSAGGGLVAALSLMARDRNEVNIAFQMPLYPMLDHTTISDEESSDTLIWDLNRNEIAWKLYLADLYETDTISQYAVPMLAEDFSNLPPTYTFVGAEDPFYEDTLDYVNKLEQAGVKIDHEVYEGAYHGFDIVAPDAKISQKAWENLFKAYDAAIIND